MGRVPDWVGPVLGEGPPGAPVDGSALWTWLRANRIRLTALPAETGRPWRERYGERWLDAVAGEQRARARALQAHATVCRAVSTSGALLFKGWSAFPFLTSNLDVLVVPEAARLVDERLTTEGYVELPHLEEPYKRYYVDPDPRTDRLPVHLHTRVAWINTFLDARRVFAEAVRHSEDTIEFWTPSPRHVVLATWAHAFFENKRYTLQDALTVRDCLEDRADALDQALRIAREQGWGRAAMRLARAHRRGLRSVDWPMRFSRGPVKCRQMLVAATNPHVAIEDRAQEMLAVPLYAAAVKLPRSPFWPTLVVELSGPDGAGKSTLARSVAARCRLHGLPTGLRWSRVAVSPAFRWVRRLGGGARAAGAAAPAARPRTARLGAVVALDYALRHALARLGRLGLGGVWVLDRGSADAILELRTRYAGHLGVEALCRTIERVGRRSLRFVLLPRSLERLLARAQPGDVGRAAESWPAYVELARHGGFATVDTSQPESGALADVMRRVLRGWSTSFGRTLLYTGGGGRGDADEAAER